MPAVFGECRAGKIDAEAARLDWAADSLLGRGSTGAPKRRSRFGQSMGTEA